AASTSARSRARSRLQGSSRAGSVTTRRTPLPRALHSADAVVRTPVIMTPPTWHRRTRCRKTGHPRKTAHSASHPGTRKGGARRRGRAGGEKPPRGPRAEPLEPAAALGDDNAEPLLLELVPPVPPEPLVPLLPPVLLLAPESVAELVPVLLL